MSDFDLSRIVQSVETLYNPSCSSMEKKEASQLLSTLSNSENARFIAMSLMESWDPSIWMVLCWSVVVTTNTRIFASNMLLDIMRREWKACPDESIVEVLRFAEKYLLSDFSVW